MPGVGLHDYLDMDLYAKFGVASPGLDTGADGETGTFRLGLAPSCVDTQVLSGGGIVYADYCQAAVGIKLSEVESGTGGEIRTAAVGLLALPTVDVQGNPVTPSRYFEAPRGPLGLKPSDTALAAMVDVPTVKAGFKPWQIETGTDSDAPRVKLGLGAPVFDSQGFFDVAATAKAGVKASGLEAGVSLEVQTVLAGLKSSAGVMAASLEAQSSAVGLKPAAVEIGAGNGAYTAKAGIAAPGADTGATVDSATAKTGLGAPQAPVPVAIVEASQTNVAVKPAASAGEARGYADVGQANAGLKVSGTETVGGHG